MNKIEKKFWRRVWRFSFVFRICPFLRMAAVCNNLAFGKVDEKSDIDVFVIAKSGRLFFVRTFLTLFLHVLGVRRHGKKVAERFCLSFFVDDEFLDMSPIAIDNDVYLAYWIKSMLPIVDDGVSRDFMKKNFWGKEFFENSEDFEISLKFVCGNRSFLRKILQLIFGGKIGNFLENTLKKWQLKRCEGKIRKLNDAEAQGIFVNEHVLKFHNVDRRRQWRREWLKKYGDEKIADDRFLSLRPL